MLLSDSYKTSHWRQYPPKTTKVYSYFESRGGVFPEVCFFGLQYFLKRYLVGRVVTKEKIDAAERIIDSHMGLGEMKHFNRDGWQYILDKHEGRLPVVIKAVPEGMCVPVKNVMLTIENTDPAVFWLTNYLETMLVQVWYPMTVCTQSRFQKQTIIEYMQKTGCPIESFVDLAYRLNDFGCRGVSSMESAGLGGVSHLVNFGGGDTMPALIFATEYYSHKLEAILGTSIPAAEHSTITSWGKEGELDAFRNMLVSYPKGLVAVVSDSYSIYNACENLWGKELRELILAREGTLVIRPDSGDPPKVVVEVLEILGKAFGTTETPSGFRLLPPQVRVIQGDGISYESLQTILESMAQAKWATANLAFGSGGALLQRLNRDTQKCAFKCCEIIADGVTRDVFKDPITDPGKVSKKGQLKLVKRGGVLTTLCSGEGDREEDLLVEVFRDGVITKEWTFEEVRKRSEIGLSAQIW